MIKPTRNYERDIDPVYRMGVHGDNREIDLTETPLNGTGLMIPELANRSLHGLGLRCTSEGNMLIISSLDNTKVDRFQAVQAAGVLREFEGQIIDAAVAERVRREHEQSNHPHYVPMEEPIDVMPDYPAPIPAEIHSPKPAAARHNLLDDIVYLTRELSRDLPYGTELEIDVTTRKVRLRNKG